MVKLVYPLKVLMLNLVNETMVFPLMDTFRYVSHNIVSLSSRDSKNTSWTNIILLPSVSVCYHFTFSYKKSLFSEHFTQKIVVSEI